MVLKLLAPACKGLCNSVYEKEITEADLSVAFLAASNFLLESVLKNFTTCSGCKHCISPGYWTKALTHRRA